MLQNPLFYSGSSTLFSLLGESYVEGSPMDCYYLRPQTSIVHKQCIKITY